MLTRQGEMCNNHRKSYIYAMHCNVNGIHVGMLRLNRMDMDKRNIYIHMNIITQELE